MADNPHSHPSGIDLTRPRSHCIVLGITRDVVEESKRTRVGVHGEEGTVGKHPWIRGIDIQLVRINAAKAGIQLRQGSGQVNHVCFIELSHEIDIRSCPHITVGDNCPRTDGEVIDTMSSQRLEYPGRIEGCHSLAFPASFEANEYNAKACLKRSPASSVNLISTGVTFTAKG